MKQQSVNRHSVENAGRTIHELSLLHSDLEPLRVFLQVQTQNMESSTTVVTFYRQFACLMLHSKVVSNGSSSIADEIVRWGEATTGKEIVKEVIQGFLYVMLVLSNHTYLRLFDKK